MSFSDLVHAVERDVEGAAKVLLPQGLPSDTREAEALAKDAEKVAVTLDPELEPIFAAIASVGNAIEGSLHELGTHVGTLKGKLAARAAGSVMGEPVIAGAVPVGVPDPAAGPQPTITDLQRAANEAALARQQAEVEPGDPNPVPSAQPTANPPEPEVPAAPTPDPALAQAEANFAELSDADKAAFEAAEGLQATPPPS